MLAIIKELEKELWPIDKLVEWSENPRRAREDGIERLKASLTKFDMFKPLKVMEDGTVLGGNMRLRVLRSMGVQSVWVHIVKPSNKAQMVEICLADNDSIGYYDDSAVAELLSSVGGISSGFESIRINSNPPKVMSSVFEKLDSSATQDAHGATDDTEDAEEKKSHRKLVLEVQDKKNVEYMLYTLQSELGLDSWGDVLMVLLDRFIKENV